MPAVAERTWVEHLSPPRCRELLETTEVGRVAVLVDSAPEIFPVNYVYDGRGIVFRTARGSKLRGALRSPAVCFEIDAFDVEAQTGWSVMVKGMAVELITSEDQAAVSELALRVWTAGEKAHWIRIQPDSITGRRIYHASEPAGSPQ
jgi:nitroimidazol reductase NimA-like FMN-containing flavoprotein (pyridoxamine 5'-phosphate oxidase superfamily)